MYSETKLDLEPIIGYSPDFTMIATKGEIIQEFGIKPLRDRLYISGFSPPIRDQEYLYDGFRFPVSGLPGVKVEYMIESYFPNGRNIEKMVIKCIRLEDWDLDQPTRVNINNLSIQRAVQKMLPEHEFDHATNIKYKHKFYDSFSSEKITITPGPNTTPREIIYELAKQYKFYWVLDFNNTFHYFKKESYPEAMLYDEIVIDPAGMARVPDGWIGRDQSMFVRPGTRADFDKIDKDLFCAHVKAYAKSSADGFYTVMFADPKEYFDVNFIKGAEKSDKDRVTEWHNWWNVPAYTIESSTINDNTMGGKYITTKSQLSGNDVGDDPIDNVYEVVPWSTKDGHGIRFPRKDEKSTSVVIPISKGRSAAIGDIAVDGNDGGTKFIIDLPGDAYLEYDTTSNTWTLEGATIKIGGNASDPVIRKSDLTQMVNDFNNHTHISAAPSSPTGTPTASTPPIRQVVPNGSSKVKSE